MAHTTLRRPDTAAGTGGRRNLTAALVVIAAAQLMVVLDATIVNVALPHIQHALGFSGTGLEWVVNAYALSFGGLMLLGGRAGDLLGRRRVLVAGLLLFSAASLAGGFATSQAWLLTTRAVQGAGGAMIAPTALALITTTFAEGAARNRAMGVYAAMSGGGAAIGLVAGGLLTTYVSWRWVLFVNVPIGIGIAAAAKSVLPESARRMGRFDLVGAITGTAGVALLVYGLSNAGTDQRGISHWTDTRVVASLVASAVLLVTFVLIERRSRNLPFAGTVAVVSGIVSNLVARTGARPLLLAGAAVITVGLYWFSRISAHVTYAGGLLGPIVVTAAGIGTVFVPLSLVALNRVRDEDSGLASSLLNAGQQIGGAIGLAALGTVTWTVAASSLRSQAARAVVAAARLGHAPRPGQLRVSWYDNALAAGVSRGFLVAAGFALVMLVITALAIRARGEDPAADEVVEA